MVALAACDLGGESPRVLGDRLNAAPSAAEERVVLAKIRRPGMTLRGLDGAGRPLEFSRAGWSTQLDRVEIGIDGQTIRHKMIDPQNVFILLGE